MDDQHIHKVTAKAPAKIILFGEHSVVYGKHAIGISIGLHTYCTVTYIESEHTFSPPLDSKKCVNISYDDDDIQVSFNDTFLASLPQISPDTDTQISSSISDTIAKLYPKLGESYHLRASTSILFLFLGIIGLPQHNYTLSITSEIPVGVGLGSSSAFHTSVAGALISSRDQLITISTHNRKLINTWAHIGEKIVHGTPSGIDDYVSTHGGAVIYQKLESKRIMKPLLVDFDSLNLTLLIINSKQSRSTKQLVSFVRHRKNTVPKTMEIVLNAMDQVVLDATEILSNFNSQETETRSQFLSSLGHLIDINQGLCDAIGVNHPVLSKILQICTSNGFHAKLTGAGGGGCAFCLTSTPQNSDSFPPNQLASEIHSTTNKSSPISEASESVKQLKEHLNRANFQVFSASIGVQGLSISHTSSSIITRV